jgi:sRNA-binding regulator protein Hfq
MIITLGIITLGCQKPVPSKSTPVSRVILKTTSYDHPLLVQQRLLIEKSRPQLEAQEIQVDIEIFNPNMFALREMSTCSYYVILLDKDGHEKAVYKAQVVPISTILQGGGPITPTQPVISKS